MSVTFNLSSEFTFAQRPFGDTPFDSPSWETFHEQSAELDGEFNVANSNAHYILSEILNLGSDVEAWGSIDPSTVLMRTSYVNVDTGVTPERVSQGTYIDDNGVGPGCALLDMGRHRGQVESYVTRLRRLAEIAIEREAPEILWG